MARNQCILTLNSILNDVDLATKVEKSIYDYTVDKSTIKCIDENIENKYFKRIYVNKLISLYNNKVNVKEIYEKINEIEL